MKEPISRLWQKFIDDRKYLKNVSANTLDAYRCAWNAWATALPQHVADIGPDTVLDVVIALKKRTWKARVGKSADGTPRYEDVPLADITLDSYLRILRTFFNWLHQRKHLPAPVKVDKIAVDVKVMRVFSKDELDALLSYTPEGKNAIRAALLVSVILDTGLRAKEALTLRTADVDIDTQCALVRQPKGRKQRIVPLSRLLCFQLKPWLAADAPEFLFSTSTGRPVSYRNALRDFQAICNKLGIGGKRASFHTLRATFATGYSNLGGNVFKLQRIMGHSTLAMTQRYVAQSTQDLVRDHDRMSPLASRRK